MRKNPPLSKKLTITIAARKTEKMPPISRRSGRTGSFWGASFVRLLVFLVLGAAVFFFAPLLLLAMNDSFHIAVRFFLRK